MKQGNIGVTTENIFPVIKKFLYNNSSFNASIYTFCISDKVYDYDR